MNLVVFLDRRNFHVVLGVFVFVFHLRLGRFGFERIDGGWQVRPELTALASFAVENLLECAAPRGSYDLIACRNLVIYFTDESRATLHRMLAGALRPGGWLLVGSTERVADAAAHGLELVYPFIYHKS